MTLRATPPGWRLWLAFAILPPANALMAYAAFPVLWYLGDHGGMPPVGSGGADGGLAVLVGVLAAVVTVGGAVPVVLSLMKRGPLTVGRLVLAGIALGNVPLAFYAIAAAFFAILHLAAGTMSQHLMPLSSLLAGTLRAVLLGSAMGAASAVVFWFVGIRGADS